MAKQRKRWGTSVDIDLLKGLQELSDKTRIPQSKLVDEALEDLIKKYKDKGIL